MSEFFEIPPATPEPSTPQPEEPPWMSPPRGVVAGIVDPRQVIARTDRLVVLLSHIDAFPVGALIRIRVMGRRSEGMSDREWWDFHETVMGHRGWSESSAEAPEFLRIGVEYPDGRKATNLAQASYADPAFRLKAPPQPSLVQLGAGGSGSPDSFAVGRKLWLWPLPPAETFDLVIEWPAYGVPVTRVPIDGAAVVSAAEQAEPAWPD